MRRDRRNYATGESLATFIADGRGTRGAGDAKAADLYWKGGTDGDAKAAAADSEGGGDDAKSAELEDAGTAEAALPADAAAAVLTVGVGGVGGVGDGLCARKPNSGSAAFFCAIRTARSSSTFFFALSLRALFAAISSAESVRVGGTLVTSVPSPPAGYVTDHVVCALSHLHRHRAWHLRER